MLSQVRRNLWMIYLCSIWPRSIVCVIFTIHRPKGFNETHVYATDCRIISWWRSNWQVRSRRQLWIIMSICVSRYFIYNIIAKACPSNRRSSYHPMYKRFQRRASCLYSHRGLYSWRLHCVVLFFVSIPDIRMTRTNSTGYCAIGRSGRAVIYLKCLIWNCSVVVDCCLDFICNVRFWKT